MCGGITLLPTGAPRLWGRAHRMDEWEGRGAPPPPSTPCAPSGPCVLPWGLRPLHPPPHRAPPLQGVLGEAGAHPIPAPTGVHPGRGVGGGLRASGEKGEPPSDPPKGRGRQFDPDRGDRCEPIGAVENKLPQDALNPAHGSLLRVNSHSHLSLPPLTPGGFGGAPPVGGGGGAPCGGEVGMGGWGPLWGGGAPWCERFC